MNKKFKNSLILIGVLAGLFIIWAIAYFAFQRPKINKTTKEIQKIKRENSNWDTTQLRIQLDSLKARFLVIDSLLAARKYNVPHEIHQAKFFQFVNEHSRSFGKLSFVNVEYQGVNQENAFKYHTYNVTGKASFSEIFTLLYAIEESKEIKKLKLAEFSGTTEFDENKIAFYLVNFVLQIAVYTFDDNRFEASRFYENDLKAPAVTNLYYPLLRADIEPNIYNLLEVQSAKLLAILPDGAFFTNDKGESYLLREGDEVYLGYLTRIDRNKSKVYFVLNKGGIIENVVLDLPSQNSSKEKR